MAKRFPLLILLFLLAAPAHGGEIKGEAFYRARMALSPEAIFEVTLEDVSLADAKATILAKEIIKNPGQVPIAFTLKYDDEKIKSNHRYSVRAKITDRGRLMFTTDQAYPPFVDGKAQELKLMMVPVTGSKRQAHTLTDTYWKLQSLKGKDITPSPSPRSEAHLLLMSKENRFSGSGGCNTFTGTYKWEGQLLEFSTGPSTMMACIDPFMEQDQKFIQALQETDGYRIQGKQLELLKGKKVVAGLEAIPR